MPNWCEGTFKVRGNFEDIKRYVKENIKVYEPKIIKEPDGSVRFDHIPVPDAIVYEFDEPDSEEFEMTVKDDAHINGSRRHFIIPGTYYCIKQNRRKAVMVLRFKAAWYIDTQPFIEMSKRYNVDFRLYGCETGMEFNQEVIIENGELIKDDEIRFDNYMWDCPFSDLGG